MSDLRIVPITLREANRFVELHHRHHGGRNGHKFSVGVQADGELVGVAIAGRPNARHLDDGLTLEVLRVCTDGTPNACSKLYGAVRKAAHALGYEHVVTYTLATEHGASLRAAGFIAETVTRGGSWDREDRRREDTAPLDPKVRWVA